jgi:colicin import membrane protein
VTRKTGATTATAEKEAETLGEEIKRMEGELAALESERAELDAPAKAPSWDELQQAGAFEELEARERRRGVLPRLIAAARAKLVELRIRREEAELGPLKAERESAYAAMEEAKAEARRAEEKRQAALARWGFAHERVHGREQRVERATRELAELREGRR